jgi:hypothetical protein
MNKSPAWLLVATATIAGGCAAAAANQPLPYQVRDEIDEGPPRLEGQKTDLRIDAGILHGHLGGGDYNIKVSADRAQGSSPLGPTDVRIVRRGSGYEVAGTWNGGRLDLLVDDHGARGDVMKQVSPEERGYQACHYDIEPTGRGPVYSGLAECLGYEPLRVELVPTPSSALDDEQNAILLVAYLAAPPPVRAL